jgi:predicted ABC-type ATPase
MPAIIDVLAGVNGAGKSSVIGEAIIRNGGEFYNPDKMAKLILEKNPTSTLSDANSIAWEKGRQGIETALTNDDFFAFETTLGGNTITELLLKGIHEHNAEINLSYVGLISVELHIERVKKRVASGGHDIPEEKIKQRYQTSRQNLIKLMPYLSTLYIYDNSTETDSLPKPVKLLQMEERKIKHIVPLEQIPKWAKPLLTVALKIDSK